MSTLIDANNLKLWDYRIQHFDGSELLVIGSNNLVYYHDVELVFTDVCRIDCAINFHPPQFHDFGPCPCGCGASQYHIQAEDSEFTIAAEKLEIVLGTVFHYQRNELKPGERIAPWV